MCLWLNNRPDGNWSVATNPCSIHLRCNVSVEYAGYSSQHGQDCPGGDLEKSDVTGDACAERCSKHIQCTGFSLRNTSPPDTSGGATSGSQCSIKYVPLPCEDPATSHNVSTYTKISKHHVNF